MNYKGDFHCNENETMQQKQNYINFFLVEMYLHFLTVFVRFTYNCLHFLYNYATKVNNEMLKCTFCNSYNIFLEILFPQIYYRFNVTKNISRVLLKSAHLFISIYTNKQKIKLPCHFLKNISFWQYYNINAGWFFFWGGGRVCVCVCVCVAEDLK